MRFAVDSNILVYAFVVDDPGKHAIASEIMVRSMTLDCVLAVQTVAEFLNVIRRKHPQLFEPAQAQARRWSDIFDLVGTTTDHMLEGANFAGRYKLQLWDSIIWQVVRSAHAVLFLTEDLQDQVTIEGMKALNPFAPANREELQNLLSSGDHDIEC